MLKAEAAAQILFGSMSIAEKEVLLSTLLLEREAAIGVAATYFAALMLSATKADGVTPEVVLEETKRLIVAANNNPALIKAGKEAAIGFVEQRLKAVS